MTSLADGRTLAWYEFGDRQGVPALFQPGASTSGLAGAALNQAAQRVGVRLLSIDRPGLGHSDPAPHRRLRDWSRDIEQLANAQRLDAFIVIGQSGGGTHALALAHGLAHRIPLTIIAAGLGPYDEAWMRTPATLDRRTRRYYWLIRHAEPIFRAMFTLGFSDDIDALEQKTLAVDPATPDGRFYRQHRDLTRQLLAGNIDAARQGPRWPVQDLRVPLLPWGFALADTPGRISWWHGTRDRNVSIAAGKATAARLPHCTFHEIVDTGHMLLLDRMTQILQEARDQSA